MAIRFTDVNFSLVMSVLDLRRNCMYTLKSCSKSVRRFILAIERASHYNKHFLFAMREWDFYKMSDPSDTKYEKCVCGGYIKRKVTIVNRFNGKKLVVAAQHLDSILEDESDWVFRRQLRIYNELRKVTKCVERYQEIPSLSLITVNYMYKNKFIDRAELSLISRCQTSNTGLILCILEKMNLISAENKIEYASLIRHNKCKNCKCTSKSPLFCLKCFERRYDLCGFCGSIKYTKHQKCQHCFRSGVRSR